MYGELMLFAGNSNIDLAEKIANQLDTKICNAEVKKFADGETYVNLRNSVRNKDVFIIQSTCNPANDHLMELLIMIDAAKRAAAGRVIAVMPYYGYSKQDRKTEHWEPISAKLVANLITAAGADGILTMDLHSLQIQGFFDIPVDVIYASQVLVKYISEKNITNPIIVAPDVGSSRRARQYAKRLNYDLVIVDKRRPKPNESEVVNVIGDVKDKTAIIVDDEINTGGTIVNAANALVSKGAREVYVMASHAIFAADCVDKLKNSPIKEVIVTDSVAIPDYKKFSKLKVVSVASLFAEAIKRIHEGRSVSDMLK